MMIMKGSFHLMAVKSRIGCNLEKLKDLVISVLKRDFTNRRFAIKNLRKRVNVELAKNGGAQLDQRRLASFIWYILIGCPGVHALEKTAFSKRYNAYFYKGDQ